jgi:hypothetical protein
MARFVGFASFWSLTLRITVDLADSHVPRQGHWATLLYPAVGEQRLLSAL